MPAANGTGLSYQWQMSANGIDWSDVTGATNCYFNSTVTGCQ